MQPWWKVQVIWTKFAEVNEVKKLLNGKKWGENTITNTISP